MKPARAWASVAVLTLVNTVNYMDRSLTAILAEPIKHDLHLTDAMIGFINGFGVVIVFAVLGFPIARIADRGFYGLVVSVALTFWSGMTALGGLAATGTQLALTRMGAAVGEAGNIPASHAFIARHFPPERRAAPLALFATAAPLSTIAGLAGGGLLGHLYGWRMACLIMGAVGLALAPIVLLLLGTGRRAAPGEAVAKPSPSAGGARTLLRNRSFLLIIAGACCVQVSGYSFSFAPAFLMRSHGMAIGEVGVVYGLISGIIGIVGTTLIGALIGRLAAQSPARLLLSASLLVSLAVPFGIAAFVVEGQLATILCLAISHLVVSAYLAPVIGAFQRLTPEHLRASASAMFVGGAAIAGGFGPLVIGLISDALQPRFGAGSLGYAMLLIPLVQMCAAVVFLIASRASAANATA